MEDKGEDTWDLFVPPFTTHATSVYLPMGRGSVGYEEGDKPRVKDLQVLHLLTISNPFLNSIDSDKQLVTNLLVCSIDSDKNIASSLVVCPIDLE